MTAQLSWHVKNCDLVWSLYFMLEKRYFFTRYEWWAHKPCVNQDLGSVALVLSVLITARALSITLVLTVLSVTKALSPTWHPTFCPVEPGFGPLHPHPHYTRTLPHPGHHRPLQHPSREDDDKKRHSFSSILNVLRASLKRDGKKKDQAGSDIADLQVAFEVDIDSLGEYPPPRPRHQRHHSMDDLLDGGPRHHPLRTNSCEPQPVTRRNPNQVMNRKKQYDANEQPHWFSSPSELSPVHQPSLPRWDQVNGSPMTSSSCGSPYQHGSPAPMSGRLRSAGSADVLGRTDSELWGEYMEGKGLLMAWFCCKLPDTSHL